MIELEEYEPLLMEIVQFAQDSSGGVITASTEGGQSGTYEGDDPWDD